MERDVWVMLHRLFFCILLPPFQSLIGVRLDSFSFFSFSWLDMFGSQLSSLDGRRSAKRQVEEDNSPLGSKLRNTG